MYAELDCVSCCLVKALPAAVVDCTALLRLPWPFKGNYWLESFVFWILIPSLVFPNGTTRLGVFSTA